MPIHVRADDEHLVRMRCTDFCTPHLFTLAVHRFFPVQFPNAGIRLAIQVTINAGMHPVTIDRTATLTAATASDKAAGWGRLGCQVHFLPGTSLGSRKGIGHALDRFALECG